MSNQKSQHLEVVLLHSWPQSLKWTIGIRLVHFCKRAESPVKSRPSAHGPPITLPLEHFLLQDAAASCDLLHMARVLRVEVDADSFRAIALFHNVVACNPVGRSAFLPAPPLEAGGVAWGPPSRRTHRRRWRGQQRSACRCRPFREPLPHRRPAPSAHHRIHAGETFTLQNNRHRPPLSNAARTENGTGDIGFVSEQRNVVQAASVDHGPSSAPCPGGHGDGAGADGNPADAAGSFSARCSGRPT